MLTDGQSQLQVFASPREAIEKVLQILNERVRETSQSEETREALRRLVQDWVDSAKNTERLFTSQPMLANVAVQAYLRGTTSSVATVVLTLTTDFHGATADAVGIFLNFLANPLNESLSGPCVCCGKYYIKRTKRKVSRYCSPKCGRRVTSRLANQKTRERDSAKRLKRVKKALKEWKAGKSMTPWKEAVSRSARVSKKWITQAVKAKVISEPGKRGQRRMLKASADKIGRSLGRHRGTRPNKKNPSSKSVH
jgi:hypothetical protein